jgi:predicted aspartyl protease
MEQTTMGRVLTEVTVENLSDLYDVQKGQRTSDQVRRLVIPDALVDTGGTTLALPTRLLQQLGLSKRYEKRATSSRGTGMVSVYEAVRITIQGRDCTVDVVEIPNDVPALVGQISLEMMDLVVDPHSRRLVGNPAHGGEQTLELY